jgi:hypothetical protein
MNDPATTGTRWAMPKNPGTGHSVCFPGDRRFPPPCICRLVKQKMTFVGGRPCCLWL